MAIVHISEAEAARDFGGLMARVRSGERVYIDVGDQTVAILQPPSDAVGKSLSEAIRWAETQGSQVRLDDQFKEDL